MTTTAEQILDLSADEILAYLASRVAEGDVDAAGAFIRAWRARQRARIDRLLADRGRRIAIGVGAGIGVAITVAVVHRRRRRRALAAAARREVPSSSSSSFPWRRAA